jgi:hypothetical protein
VGNLVRLQSADLALRLGKALLAREPLKPGAENVAPRRLTNAWNVIAVFAPAAKEVFSVLSSASLG